MLLSVLVLAELRICVKVEVAVLDWSVSCLKDKSKVRGDF